MVRAMTAFTTHHTGTNCLTDATAPGGHGTGAAVPDAPRLIDPGATIDEYLDHADWRINANANQDFSLGGMMLNYAGGDGASVLEPVAKTPQNQQIYKKL